MRILFKLLTLLFVIQCSSNVAYAVSVNITESLKNERLIITANVLSIVPQPQVKFINITVPRGGFKMNSPLVTNAFVEIIVQDLADAKILLQHDITAKGLRIKAPVAILQIGDKTHTPELNFAEGQIDFHVREFDLYAGALVAKKADIRSETQNRIGRIIRHPTKKVIATFGCHAQRNDAHSLGNNITPLSSTFMDDAIPPTYDGNHLLTFPWGQSNGATLLVKNQARFTGPLDHQGYMKTGSLVLDSDKPSAIRGGKLDVTGNFELRGTGGLELIPGLGKFKHKITVPIKYCGVTSVFDEKGLHSGAIRRFVAEADLTLVCSNPAELRVGGVLNSASSQRIINTASQLHTNNVNPNVVCENKEFKTSLYQEVVEQLPQSGPIVRLGFQPKTVVAAPILYSPNSINPSVNCYPGYDQIFESHEQARKNFEICVSGKKKAAERVFHYQVIYDLDGRENHLKQFLTATNNFEHAKNTFVPNLSSVGTIEFPASIAQLEGRISAPRARMEVSQTGAVFGAPGNRFAPGQVERNVDLMSFALCNGFAVMNVGAAMAHQVASEVSFAMREKYWVNLDHDAAFYSNIADKIFVLTPAGQIEKPAGHRHYSMTPNLLIDALQSACQSILNRGNLFIDRRVDRRLLAELHANMADFVEDNTSIRTGRFIYDYAPTKPVIYYVTARNEEGGDELMPKIYLPLDIVIKANGSKKTLLNVKQLLLKSPSSSDASQAVIDPNTPLGKVTIYADIWAEQIFVETDNGIVVHGHMDACDILLSSLKEGVEVSGLMTRHATPSGYADKLDEARVHAIKILEIRAHGNVEMRGVDTKAGIKLHVEALGDILDVPIDQVTQTIESFGRKTVVTTVRDPHGNRHEAEQVTFVAGGNIVVSKSNLAGTKGDMEAGGKVYYVDAQKITESHTTENQKKSTNKQTKTDVISAQGQGTITNFTEGMRVKADQGAVIQSLDAQGTQTTIDAPHTLLKQGARHVKVHSFSVSKGRVWNKNRVQDDEIISYLGHNPNSPMRIQRGEVDVEVAEGGKMPPHVTMDDSVISTLIEQKNVSEHFADSKSMLTQNARVGVVAIVTAITAGVAGPAAGAAEAARNAAMTHVATNMAINTIEGNLGQAVTQSFTLDAVKGTMLSAATAGVTHGMMGHLGIDASPQSNLASKAKAAAVRTAVSAPLKTVLGRGSLRDNLRDAAISNAVNAAASHASFQIGEAYENGEIDYFVHKILHSAVGAGMSLAVGQDVVSGALGAAVAEIVAEAWKKTEMSNDDDNDVEDGMRHKFDQVIEDEIASADRIGVNDLANHVCDIASRAEVAGKLASIAAAFVIDGDAQAAFNAGSNAVENNTIAHAAIAAITLASAIWTASDVYHAYVEADGGEDGVIAALKVLGFDVVINLAGGPIGKAVIKTGAFAGKSAAFAFKEVVQSSPLLKHALEKAERVVAKSLGQPQVAMAGRQPAITITFGNKVHSKVGGGSGKPVKPSSEAKLKARMDEVHLPSGGEFPYVPPKNYKPSMPLPKSGKKNYVDAYGNVWKKGEPRGHGIVNVNGRPTGNKPQDLFEWDVQLYDPAKRNLGKEHRNVSTDGIITHGKGKLPK